jgi:hypothetical protein
VSSSSASCAFPTNVALATDPGCLVKLTNSTGVEVSAAKSNAIFDQLNSTRSKFGRYFADLARAWWVILVCSICVAFGVGIVWVQVLKLFTPCFVWTIILGTNLVLIVLTVYFYYKAGMLNLGSTVSGYLTTAIATTNSSAVSKVTSAISVATASLSSTDYSYIAYAATGVTVIIFCVTVALLKSIALAIEVIGLGCDGLNSNPELMFFPLVNVFTYGAFCMWWIFVTACVATASTTSFSATMTSSLTSGLTSLGISTGNFSLAGMNNSLATVSAMDNVNYLLIYWFFGLLWTTNFISGVYTVTVAGAVCAWYFSCMPAEVEADPKMAALKYEKPRCNLAHSCWRALRYHSGSISAGSLMLAIIGFIRAVMLYISYKLKSAAEKNTAIKFLLCCINSCLACIQKCVEVLTKNAYIFIALKGEGFCAAGGRVFGLIIAHTGVFAVVGVMSEMLMLLGKVSIAVISAWAAYLIMSTRAEFMSGGINEISATWLVILIVLFFAFFIGSGFMDVFSLTIDSVLVCYCTDIDENQARNGNDASFAVPIHMRPDKVAFKNRADKKSAETGAAKGGPAVSKSTGGV